MFTYIKYCHEKKKQNTLKKKQNTLKKKQNTLKNEIKKDELLKRKR